MSIEVLVSTSSVSFKDLYKSALSTHLFVQRSIKLNLSFLVFCSLSLSLSLPSSPLVLCIFSVVVRLSQLYSVKLPHINVFN